MKNVTNRLTKRRVARPVTLLAGLAALAAFTLAPSAASASSPAGTCVLGALSQPFAQWGDTNSYELVAGSVFTASSGWTLTGGATPVAGGDPFTKSTGSLYLPAGASALSPPICVEAGMPAFRFFGVDRSPLASVVASVVYTNPAGIPVTVPVGTVTLTGQWEPSARMATLQQIGSAWAGGIGQMRLLFTALLGPAQIDDIYVDPRCKW